MLRILFLLLCIVTSSVSWSQTESSQSLLDNRFRVDPTIDQISFLVYRKNRSKSVVLVRPDGKKYYAWNHPDNVSWYEESALDIISIENPMPGPWQAVGKVTPRNNILLLSNLKLSVEKFPSRLYQTERLKFTARLTQNGDPLVVQDFLNRVRLKVTFVHHVEDPDNPELTEVPETIELGSFMDNGEGLDEVAGDGVFTVELPIEVNPGKYRAIITSGNGVFLRSVEQSVLVYPSPVQVTFIQSHEENVDHSMTVSGEMGLVLPGSIAAHFEMVNPAGAKIIEESSVEKEALSTTFAIKNDMTPGRHAWTGNVYATEGAAQRELVFVVEEHAFSVMQKLDVEESTKEYQRIQEEKRRQLEQERIQRDREEARMKGMLTILVGNLVVIVIGLIAWFIIRKLRTRKVSLPEMQLSPPPK
ncbi:TIGR03503 family protein [Vibrio sp. SCSIO 43137]|uniref:TIGR03503 family protein n=1 Tax=Vibrio sp. SCSIO 43137 TaxID=3021011 RepID=UPI0023083115|nr:TIGR03503 family protein [Vibrio sp. SCSIO 43137]WCE30438.1 TIGR03503 family protein [Vibrio sp. SCSIO 43137]